MKIKKIKVPIKITATAEYWSYPDKKLNDKVRRQIKKNIKYTVSEILSYVDIQITDKGFIHCDCADVKKWKVK